MVWCLFAFGLMQRDQGVPARKAQLSDPVALKLVEDIKSTYRGMHSYSCTMTGRTGERETLEFKRPDRYVVRQYGSDGRTVLKEAILANGVVTVTDPLNLKSYLKFRYQPQDSLAAGNSVMAMAWPPVGFGDSVIALLQDERSFLDIATAKVSFGPPTRRRFNLGKVGTDSSGQPTVELLMTDSGMTQAHISKPYSYTSTVVVGTDDHLVRSSCVVAGSNGAVAFSDQRINPDLADEDFLFKPPATALAISRPPNLNKTDPSLADCWAEVRQALRQVDRLAFQAELNHQDGGGVARCLYRFALSRDGSGRVDGDKSNPPRNRFTAVSDGNNFRFTSGAVDLKFHATLFEGILRLKLFEVPPNSEHFLNMVLRDDQRSIHGVLNASRGVSFMAAFFGREITGLDACDLPVHHMPDINRAYDIFGGSQSLKDVLGHETGAGLYIQTAFSLKTHFPGVSSVGTGYRSSGVVKFVSTMEIVDGIQLNPVFNPSLCAMDPALRVDFFQPEFQQRQPPLEGLPNTTLDGKPFSIGGPQKRNVLIELRTKDSGPAALPLAELKSIYGRDRDDGLDVVGMSLDLSRKDAAKTAADRPWPELYDGKGWNTPLVSKLGISTLPCWIFVGGSGEYQVMGGDIDPSSILVSAVNSYRIWRAWEQSRKPPPY